MVNTRFWIDDYISTLNYAEKFLFLYFLTNPHTDICGAYEVPLKYIALETGLSADKVIKIARKFEGDGKIVYRDGWVFIRNFAKHQQKNPKVALGIKNGLEQAPKWIKDSLSIDYEELSHSNSNFNIKKDMSATADAFESFWKIYPKKELKKKAKEIWLRKKLNDKLPFIVSFIEKAKLTERWQKGYIKQPPVFLNGECWNDDLQSYGTPIVIKANYKTNLDASEIRL